MCFEFQVTILEKVFVEADCNMHLVVEPLLFLFFQLRDVLVLVCRIHILEFM